MKNLFGINRYNEQKDGEKFIVKKLGDELARKREAFEKEERAFHKSAGLPAWVAIPAMIAAFVGMIGLVVFLEILDADTSFFLAMQSLGWLFVASIGFIVVGGGLTVFNMIKITRAQKSTAYAYLQADRKKLERACLDDMGVPLDAKPVDVACLMYSKKNGSLERATVWHGTTVNSESAFYVQNDVVMFAFTDCIFAVPRAWVLRVRCENKCLSVSNWTKDEPFNKGRYQAYKIRKNGNSGNLMIKPYYIVICRDGNYEEYQFFIPCYDAEPVLQAIGKPVE